MKKIASKIPSIVFTSVFLTSNAFSGTLTLDISGITIGKGKVYIGIFNKAKQYPTGRPIHKILVNANKSNSVLKLTLKAGRYAIAAFQDKNNNKKLDKNFLGMPEEKSGFSGKQVFGEPNFHQAMIVVKAKKTVSITLK